MENEGRSQLWTPPLLRLPRLSAPLMAALFFVPPPGKPVMIITEFMENGSLDTFLKVSHGTAARPVSISDANRRYC